MESFGFSVGGDMALSQHVAALRPAAWKVQRGMNTYWCGYLGDRTGGASTLESKESDLVK